MVGIREGCDPPSGSGSICARAGAREGKAAACVDGRLARSCAGRETLAG